MAVCRWREEVLVTLPSLELLLEHWSMIYCRVAWSMVVQVTDLTCSRDGWKEGGERCGPAR